MTLVDDAHPGARPVTVWHLVHSGQMPDPVPAPKDVQIIEPTANHAELSAEMYARVGAPWHWVDRCAWSDEQWQDWVRSAGYWLGLVQRDGRTIGYAELVGATRIGFLGLEPTATGSGAGRWLLTDVVRRALARPETDRLTVHTCSLDHPAALDNYLARGFVLERTETEWRLVPGDPAESVS